MFGCGIRTPAKKATPPAAAAAQNPTVTGTAGPSQKTPERASLVRRSIGEWEAGETGKAGKVGNPPATPQKTAAKDTALTQRRQASSEKVAQRQLWAQGTGSPPGQAPPVPKYASRVDEARACLVKAKSQMAASRNLKTDIKTDVVRAVERLYQLVKEAEMEKEKKGKGQGGEVGKTPATAEVTAAAAVGSDQALVVGRLEEQTRLLQEHGRRMEEIQKAVERQGETLERAMAAASYASVTATPKEGAPQPTTKRSTLHSIVVTSKNETETGEEVLKKVRNAVDAKDGWVKVERIRKARDRKIIMGFTTKDERDKAKGRILKQGVNLAVEEVRNKDPLLVLWGVLKIHTDEELVTALRNQNRGVFHGLEEGEDRVEVRYRKRARNPLTAHVVIRVSPAIWKRAVEQQTVHIDLQRIRVEDQTPLVQCTRCLGFGHGRRHCTETVDVCSHCGGPHLRAECADMLAGLPPKCRNCTKANQHNCEHNAFSTVCPTRRRWDDLARTAVAYC